MLTTMMIMTTTTTTTTATRLPFVIMYHRLHRRRWISSHTARTILGLPTTTTSTMSSPLNLPQLRQAYLQAAKQCHPDLILQQQRSSSSNDENRDSSSSTTTTTSTTISNVAQQQQQRHQDFLRVTAAYECLQREVTGKSSSSSVYDDDSTTTTTFYNDDDYDFRTACVEHLGLSAESVEECKQNPIFRQWLHGNNSHWAQLWRAFLAGHGGWAPQLLVQPYLPAGNNNTTTTRRRRKRRW